MEKENTLKSCPFCGGEAVLLTDDYESEAMVVCGNCKARTIKIATDTHYHITDKVIELWNRRADSE